MTTNERILTPAIIREINKEESAEDFPVFLTIYHSTLSFPLRFVSDPKSFVLSGNTYTGFPFGISLLTDSDELPYAQLKIQNVDSRIGETLLSPIAPATLDIECYALSGFNLNVTPRTPIGTPTRIYRATDLYLTDVSCADIFLTGKIISWDYTQEPYPGLRATKDRMPGLFR